MISVLDIGIGNINSVQKALNYIGAKHVVITDENGLKNAEKILFPGVGNFGAASQKLHSTEMASVIRSEVLENKTPFLGICLGMQLLARSSNESGYHKGLGLVDAEVIKIPESESTRIPHMGWNDVWHDSSGLFEKIESGSDFYFVHSFYMDIKDDRAKYFTTTHGVKVTAYVEKDNIYGAQFHPEKSQEKGIQFLKNFDDLC
jgi:imidazole glycerol-phosphate synthase subunit HisH